MINEILSNYDDDFIQLKKDVFPITDYNSTDFNTESLKKNYLFIFKLFWRDYTYRH